jgi:poly-beta-1,6-N-acetyl-D-glucosamine synthase
MIDVKACSYVLVTPVRNEGKTIEVTLQSVIRQTVQPIEWVIVSDESTDNTDPIVARYAAEHDFIQFLRLNGRPSRNFASVVFAVQAGLAVLKNPHYDFIGLLDADIRVAEDYYEQMLGRFAADPSLGLAGGLVLDNVGGKRIHHQQNLRDVAGAVQFFRRCCFECLGGLIAIPEGGWDAVTCVRARMAGFNTATFPDLIVDHLKPRNISEGNLFRRHWQFGVRDYALGSHPLFEAAKCCARSLESPLLLGAVARLLGYCWAGVSRRKQFLSRETMSHIRREQLRRFIPFKPR